MSNVNLRAPLKVDEEVFLETTELHTGTATMKQQKMLERIKYFEAKRSPLESFMETMASKMVAVVLNLKKSVEEKIPEPQMKKFWKSWTDFMLGY